MADINQLPVMTARDAESIGFARFNDVPTLPIDIPDGNFTISPRTSDGRRITFFFGEYERGAPPSFVDIQFPDHALPLPAANGSPIPDSDLPPLTPGGPQPHTPPKTP